MGNELEKMSLEIPLMDDLDGVGFISPPRRQGKGEIRDSSLWRGGKRLSLGARKSSQNGGGSTKGKNHGGEVATDCGGSAKLCLSMYS